MFFLYQVSPSVGASYKLSTSIILSVRFSNKHIPEHKNTIKQKIYELTVKLLERAYDLHHEIESYVSLEELNIALASRELGDDYLLPEHVLRKVFFGNDERSYFSIISCLFYTREQSQYSELHKKALKSATFILSDLSDILINSEKAYLFLDLLSCPYVKDKKKMSWIKRACTVLEIRTPSDTEARETVQDMGNMHCAVDWKDVDLLNSLEKKELKRAY